LKEIAHEVGYEDIQHFTRVCTRNFGLPPGELRSSGHLPESSPYVRNSQKMGALI
jgi:AraC-like DNA-binding protein